MSQLSSDVMTEITRLGGKWLPESKSKKAADLDLPEPIKHFLYHIRWPKRTYESDDNSAIWVWMLEFGVVGRLDPEEIPIQNGDGRDLFYFAMTDGGNYFMVLDARDPNPADPQVYQVDHSDPEQELHERATLSEFLQALTPEEA